MMLENTANDGSPSLKRVLSINNLLNRAVNMDIRNPEVYSIGNTSLIWIFFSNKFLHKGRLKSGHVQTE